jgi:high-affinity iron transporter
MVPFFVIGLREGLEAALIVGIVAAFLDQQGRRDALRWVWTGTLLAVALCLAMGIALREFERDLPQKQQEGLETVVGLVAVAVVTYMVVWMRKHSRHLKRSLEETAGSALATGSARALILMAFFAVVREGFETAVFLVAAFTSNTTSNPAAGRIGVVLGIALAVAVGYGIYRGGIKVNLAKFFRVTGLVLVLVAAGLVASAAHTAHEAGWLNSLQGQALDLTWLVRPGTVASALITGMLGIQPRPVVAEVVAWALYAIPVGVFVLWPQARPQTHRHPAGPVMVTAAPR